MAIEILDNIIFMAQQTKEALEAGEISEKVYMDAVSNHLNDAYRAMSFAAFHE